MVAIGLFLLGISIMIFVHELGHLLAAKWAGVPCHKFSVGFGPRLLGFQWGETEYQLALIPLGGYVKMEGETDGAESREERPQGLSSQPPAKRALVLSGGVLMNLFLGLAIYLGLALHGGEAVELPAQFQQVAEKQLPDMEGEQKQWSELPTNLTVVSVDSREVDTWEEAVTAVLAQTDQQATFYFENGQTFTGPVPQDDDAKMKLIQALLPPLPTIVGRVHTGGVAARAGLQTGDHLVEIDGHSVKRYMQWVNWVNTGALFDGRDRQPVELVFKREGRRHTIQVNPNQASSGEHGSPLGWLGAKLGEKRARVSTAGAAKFAGQQAKKDVQQVVESAQLIGSGAIGVDQLSGPVKMAEISRKAYQVSWYQFLAFLAFVSINLAIMNFLPIPALDGGHFMLLVVEVVRGRPLSDQWMKWLNMGGASLVVALMGLVILNDVIQLGGF